MKMVFENGEKPCSENASEERTDGISSSSNNSKGTADCSGEIIPGMALAGTVANGGDLAVEKSVASSVENVGGAFAAPFSVTAADLSNLSSERTRQALADLVSKGVLGSCSQTGETKINENKDIEQGDIDNNANNSDFSVGSKEDIRRLVRRMRDAGEIGDAVEYSNEAIEADKNAEKVANVIASVVLRSNPETGIDPREVEFRRDTFGSNAIADKETDSFLKLCWEAVQDFVLIMLIVLGIISIIMEVSTHNGPCTTCWFEGVAILVAVLIVVVVTAGIDYTKQFAFIRLTRSVNETNTKSVIRDSKLCQVVDDDIVVGDILSVNSHMSASIPADCILLGPASGLKMDESSLTGESKSMPKKPGDILLSGTAVVQGSGKMVVVAVGVNSVAGKIKARVYDSGDCVDDDLDGDSDDNSPLFIKLALIAKRIGISGTVAAVITFLGNIIIGLAIQQQSPQMIIQYLVTSITVLAVAVPEGLPLAVTLALAFSSNKMMKEQNLVKHLDACETMGCATTICTDKTGTLTANKMTARAIFIGKRNCLVDDPGVTLGAYMRSFQGGVPQHLLDKLCRCLSICTMNESILYLDEKGTVEGSSGNPTEVALLQLTHDVGSDYEQIRNTTRGRSNQGQLGEYLGQGKQYEFSSARKMMSWAVPLIGDDGVTISGYRLYCKGAAEVVLSRCDKYITEMEDLPLEGVDLDEARSVAVAYARRGMRCLALAYRDVSAKFDLEAQSQTVKNSDGTEAFEAETELTCIGLVGIEDPLRPEVPTAIEKCYQAGIDVRMVTGDNANTAVSIAYQAGILRDFHFKDGTAERVAINLKDNVLMEGKTFRSKVYRENEETGSKDFDQMAFDKIWPRLRVLARSSPDDKITLAHGLNQSNLFADKAMCKRLETNDGIKIFPDRQVVAMTGDGTNDAPALKRADIGFAMGIAGTQIAKDAADIILIDDNFASIVTAAKWGRNVYASIQKFLQFQLTVNVAAVVTAMVGAFAYSISPLAAIQLLWVNLLMDSLASLALASEPPVEELLQKPPVNRTDSMFTKHMWANMLGQAVYQITVIMILLFEAPKHFDDMTPGNVVDPRGGRSVHYTLIFNSFVWMQLFNEINSRKLKGEFNVFKGIVDNPLFYSVLITTAILQVLIVQFGSVPFHVVEGGLSGKYWGISLAIGFGSLPVQQIINILYRIAQNYKRIRYKKRFAKNRALTTQRTTVGHAHRD